jgi:hypothetical protein
MTPSTFPTFLTFPTRKMRSQISDSEPRHGVEISPCLRRVRLRPPTVGGPEGDDLAGRPEPACESPRWRLDRRSHAIR